MNKRKAKRLKIGFYQETGFGLAWETSSQKEIWEPFIDIIETHKLYFAGSFNPKGGNGIVYSQPYTKMKEEQLQNLIKDLSRLPIQNIKKYGPFDLNNPPKNLDTWLESPS
jgi:uncharacterized protein YggL (DUF469 family)